MNLDTYAQTLDLREQEIGRCRTALRQLWAAQNAGAHVVLVDRDDTTGAGFTTPKNVLVLVYTERTACWTVKFDTGLTGPLPFVASNLSLVRALSEFGQRDLPPEIRTVLQVVARATEAA